MVHYLRSTEAGLRSRDRRSSPILSSLPVQAPMRSSSLSRPRTRPERAPLSTTTRLGWSWLLPPALDSPPAGADRSSAFRVPIRYTALAMPVSRRHFAPGQLQFITSSTYRRTKLFDSHRFRCDFVEVLGQFRRKTGFLLIGWVLMPEHFHLRIKPEPAESTSRLMQELKKRTAQGIVSQKQNISRRGAEPRSAQREQRSCLFRIFASLRLRASSIIFSRLLAQWATIFRPSGACGEMIQWPHDPMNQLQNSWATPVNIFCLTRPRPCDSLLV